MVNLSIRKRLSIAGLVASAFLMSGVAAAADAIDVRNVADPGRHLYQQTVSLQCSSSPQPCLLGFPAITTARTVILHASCWLVAVDSQAFWYVSLSDSSLQIPSYLPINKNADIDGESFYTAVSDPYASFETGQQPTIQVIIVGDPSAVGVNCTLTGYYM